MTKESAAEQVSRAASIRRRLPTPRMRRAIRESSGLRVAEVAKALDVAAQTVHNWERGSRAPRGALLEAYVAVLDALAEEQHPS